MLTTVGSTTSEEAKAGSLQPSSSIAATQPSADLDGIRGPIHSQVPTRTCLSCACLLCALHLP